MAEDKKKTSRQAARRQQRRSGAKKNTGKISTISLDKLLKRREKDRDFRPDPTGSGWLKTRHMTVQQRLRYARWGLYILVCILALVIQDVIMSQIGLFGATTDLAVCAILLITVLEGTEIGSLFVLIASVIYYFSGSAPGAYCIALLTFLGTGATLFRQLFWHRSRGSVVLCAAIALWGYEIGLYIVGLMMELTNVSRMNSFLLTALYSSLCLIPMYAIVYKIGMIGGNSWKE